MTPPTLPNRSERESQTTEKPKRFAGRKLLIAIGFLILLILSIGIGIALKALHSRTGEAGGPNNLIDEAEDLGQIAIHPRDGFPGKDKIVICCMGIDDNWTNSDQVYTVGSRTDTLFLLTLDLVNRKATMLSIPRDTYVPIAGEHYSSKINSAYASGGPKRTEETIQNWLGVSPDYYIVLNIDATKKMVDALGGVDVNVEHAMNYDDNWGHLHVHLLPGTQHLTGDEAVGFARYRHGNKGVTPEDGDERRMYRQHVLMRSMIDKAKSFSTVFQADQLIDVGMSTIRTDMTRTQLFDLAALFHKLDQDSIQTAALAGEDGRGPNGVYVMVVNPKKSALYVDWLVNGNDRAGRELTPVVVQSSSPVDSGPNVVSAIKKTGFTNCRLTALPNTKTRSPFTTIIDGGVADRSAAEEIKSALALPNVPIEREVAKPNKLGWAPPPVITVVLGTEYNPAETAQPPSALP